MPGRQQEFRAGDPPAGPTDLDLLRRLSSEPEMAFPVLFQRWAPRLRRLLIRATGSRETGEDLLQEAFLRILLSAPRFEPRAEVGTWMYRICINLACSHWRHRRRAPWAGAGTGASEAQPAREAPDSRRMRRLFSCDLDAAVSRMPAHHRMVFLLKADQGLTYEEIALILRCPCGTVKSRFHHAVRRLRRDLREWEDGLDAGPSFPSRPKGDALGS